MGARTKDLLLLEDQFRSEFDDEHIHITTDDGSYGEKGVVTIPLERLLQSGEVNHARRVPFKTPVAIELDEVLVLGLQTLILSRDGVGGVLQRALHVVAHGTRHTDALNVSQEARHE